MGITLDHWRKTHLALAILVTGFLVPGNAYGEDEVYYCAETGSTGFSFDKELNKYKPQLFLEDKFKIKFDRIAKTIEIKGYHFAANDTYPCTVPFAPESEKPGRIEMLWLSCAKNLYHFSFNSDNGRFVFGQVGGYVTGDADSISVSYGTCDKF